jgi:hypothetical protein
MDRFLISKGGAIVRPHQKRPRCNQHKLHADAIGETCLRPWLLLHMLDDGAIGCRGRWGRRGVFDVERSQQLGERGIVTDGKVNTLYASQAKWNITRLVEDRYHQVTLLQRIGHFIHHVIRRHRCRGQHGDHALTGFQRFRDSAIPALTAKNIELIQPQVDADSP